MRHFRVKDTCSKKLFSSSEIDAWVDLYDTYDLEACAVDLPEVEKVFISTLSRSERTATYLGMTEYEKSSLFNEVEAKAFVDTKYRFPKLGWLIAGRILWSLGLVKRSESKIRTHKRAKEAADSMIEAKESSIMIVSHGFFMLLLARQLQKRGFKGRISEHPKHGKIYTFLKL